MIERKIRVFYRNYRGQERSRMIRPLELRWGANEWHPEPQWLLKAVDPEDGMTKEFALRDCDFRHNV